MTINWIIEMFVGVLIPFVIVTVGFVFYRFIFFIVKKFNNDTN